MAFDVEVLAHERGDVDQTDEIGLARLDGDVAVHRIIEEERVGDGLITIRVDRGDERSLDIFGHVVIPVAHGHHHLFIVHILERRLFLSWTTNACR